MASESEQPYEDETSVEKKNTPNISPFSPDFIDPVSLPQERRDKEEKEWIEEQKRLENMYRENPTLNDEEVYKKMGEDGAQSVVSLESNEDMIGENEGEERNEFEDQEGIDMEAVVFDSDSEDVYEEDEGEDEALEEEEEENYNKSGQNPSEGDAFLIIISEKGEVVDKIIFVHEISEKDITFKDEDDNDFKLNIEGIDEEKNIILQSEDYDFDIIDFDKIQEIEPVDLEDDTLFLTKNIYDDVELDVEELKDKVYSQSERKQSLITELIYLFNAEKNEEMMLDICEMAENYIQMLDENVGNDFDYGDKLPFMKNVKDGKYIFPKFIIPIVTNSKKTYPGVLDVLEEVDAANKKYESKAFKEMDYQSVAKDLYKTHNPFLTPPPSAGGGADSGGNGNVDFEYEGQYIRRCDDISEPRPSDFLKKTRKDSRIPLIDKKGETHYKTIVNKEQVSLSGVCIIPHINYNLTFDNNGVFPLFHTSILANSKYSYHPISKIFEDQKINTSHIIGPNTNKTDFPIYTTTEGSQMPMINEYGFDEFVKKDNLGKTFNKLPRITDFINTIPDQVMDRVFNHSDFRKLLHPYSIDYNSLDNENKKNINSRIKENTKKFMDEYDKRHKKKGQTPSRGAQGEPATPKEKAGSRILSTDDKIELSWKFINSVMDISRKNNYIKRYIKVFSREPTHYEDQDYLYEKDSSPPKILLCKHYIHISKVDTDPYSAQGGDEHLSLRNAYGGLPENGRIFCKKCGEYLCPEDLSILGGFTDGFPSNTREVLIKDIDTEKKELTNKQKSIMKNIKKVSSRLSLELNEFDKNSIIEFFDTLDDDNFMDIRYGYINIQEKIAAKETASFAQEKSGKKGKKTKPTKEEKEILSKRIKESEQYLKDGNEFFIITYLVLFHLQVSSPPYDANTRFHFNLWDKDDIVRNEWNHIKGVIHEKISMETVEKIEKEVMELCPSTAEVKDGKGDAFWINIGKLLKGKHPDLPKYAQQFINVGGYILSNSKLKGKLKEYYMNQNNINTSVYLKESWSSFKPLQENSIIGDIHQKVNGNFKDMNLVLKERRGISFENISSVRTIDHANKHSRREDLGIPYSEIMKNEAYMRLLEHSIHLHGVEDENKTINLTINNFIETIENRDEIEKMFIKIGWDKKEKRLKKINYNDLRKTLFEIQEIFIEKDPKEKNTIELYNHIKRNNWNGMMLNGNPKRSYSYKNPVVLPTQTFDELKEISDKLKGKYDAILKAVGKADDVKKKGDIFFVHKESGQIKWEKPPKQILKQGHYETWVFNSNSEVNLAVVDADEKEQVKDINIIKGLFQKYCFDSEGDINVKLSHDKFILNIIADTTGIERVLSCHNDIPITKGNFEKIMDYKISSNKLPSTKREEESKTPLFETRLHKFINQKKFLKFPDQDNYSLFKRISDVAAAAIVLRPDIDILEKEIVRKDFISVFEQVNNSCAQYISNIQDFIQRSKSEDILSKDQLSYYKKIKIKGRFADINSLGKLIETSLGGLNGNENHNDNIFYIIGRLSNNGNNLSVGAYLHPNIPNDWKLTDTNKKDLVDFIDGKEFLLHNDVFLESNKKYEGFYKYTKDKKYSKCFEGLLDYMRETYTAPRSKRWADEDGIYSLDGDDKSYYTSTYSKYFKKFILLYNLNRIIGYIEALGDTQSSQSRKAQELFSVLEGGDRLELKDSVIECTGLFFDILMNILEENHDEDWIYSDKDLSLKLSTQKEKEKQVLITDLEDKNDDERLVAMELQKAGITNWYHELAKKNLERIKDDKHTHDEIEEERLDEIKESLLVRQLSIEVAEHQGVNTELLIGQNEGVAREGGEAVWGDDEDAYDFRDTDREDEGDDDEDNDGDYSA